MRYINASFIELKKIAAKFLQIRLFVLKHRTLTTVSLTFRIDSSFNHLTNEFLRNLYVINRTKGEFQEEMNGNLIRHTNRPLNLLYRKTNAIGKNRSLRPSVSCHLAII